MAKRASRIRSFPQGNRALELLNVQEMASILRLNPQTLYRLARLRLIPAIRIGKKSLRFDPIQVKEALSAQGTSQLPASPKRPTGRSTAFAMLEDLLAQGRWLTPTSDLTLERFGVKLPPGTDLTALAYEPTRP